MSHLVKQTPSFAMTSLDVLEKAVTDLGGTLHRDQKSATFYGGKKAKCDHVISFPNSRNGIGVVVKPDGTFDVQGDLYDGVLRQALSSDQQGSYGHARMDKLFESYKVNELNQVSRRNNARLQTKVRLPDGRLALTYAVQG